MSKFLTRHRDKQVFPVKGKKYVESNMQIQRQHHNPQVLDVHGTVTRPDVKDAALKQINKGRHVDVATLGRHRLSDKQVREFHKEGFKHVFNGGRHSKDDAVKHAHVYVDNENSELKRASEMNPKVSTLKPKEYVEIYG